MKTISAHAGVISDFNSAREMFAGTDERASRAARPLPAWRPSVPKSQPLAATRRSSTASAPARPALWLPLGREGLAEKVMLGLLVLAAAGAIGYGFTCLVELVQNWAAFTASVGQIIR